MFFGITLIDGLPLNLGCLGEISKDTRNEWIKDKYLDMSRMWNLLVHMMIAIGPSLGWISGCWLMRNIVYIAYNMIVSGLKVET